MSIHIWLPLLTTFLLGISWRLFSRASKAYRSTLRKYASRWAFVAANWDVFLLRTVWNSAAFVVWLFHPDWIAKALIFVHWIIVTPNLATAAIFGFMVDYGLDQIQIKISSIPEDKWPSWLPDALRGEIPNYDQTAVNGTVMVQANQRDAGFGNGKTPIPTSSGGGG